MPAIRLNRNGVCAEQVAHQIRMVNAAIYEHPVAHAASKA
jgi:hypothetical protein